MRFHRKGKEHKAKAVAYRKESREHKWVLYILMALAALLSLYYFFTSGAMSLETYAELLFLIIGSALLADLMHKRNLSMLKPAVAVFCIAMLTGLTVGGISHLVQPASAYTFANGQVTSSNGAITTIIPYVTPPSTSFASSLIPCITMLGDGATCSASQLPTSLDVSWFEDEVFNLMIGVVNAVIYIANLMLSATIDLIGATSGVLETEEESAEEDLGGLS